jgi:hypothetical protein
MSERTFEGVFCRYCKNWKLLETKEVSRLKFTQKKSEAKRYALTHGRCKMLEEVQNSNYISAVRKDEGDADNVITHAMFGCSLGERKRISIPKEVFESALKNAEEKAKKAFRKPQRPKVQYLKENEIPK